ncbi:25952_t:CDS:2, partial [Dentiscutata erythropus]
KNESKIFMNPRNKKVDTPKPLVKKRLVPLFDHVPSIKIELRINDSQGESMQPTTIISDDKESYNRLQKEITSLNEETKK